MMTRQSKIYLAITAVILAVILLVYSLSNLFFKHPDDLDIQVGKTGQLEVRYRHPLTGEILPEECPEFFPVAVMIDNAYDIRPQYGLSQASIIYEALAEGNITRLMAIFDSNSEVNKLGPVRSARPYFMDWAEEYGGIYMHVGGSPSALATIDSYDFLNVDQIGAGEIYFWRDQSLDAPHNVFTSSANWLRAGEIKEVECIDAEPFWHFVDLPDDYFNQAEPPQSLAIDFSNEPYKVEWKFNEALHTYQRWQGDEKHIYDTGEQISAENIVVEVVDSKIIDDKERRDMSNKKNGTAYMINALGFVTGSWKYTNGRTEFYDEYGEPIDFVPGRTWIEVVPSKDSLISE